MINTKCPICGNHDSTTVSTIKDHSVSKEEFKLVRCANCGFLFTNPRPSTSEIGRYYEGPDYISHTNKKNSLFSLVYQKLRNHAIKKKFSTISKLLPKGAILDYGSGTGEFLNCFHKNGWSTKGVEIADSPRERSVQQYGLDVIPPTEFKEIPTNSVDVVTMWHVLEHIDDLRTQTLNIVDKLRTGGLFVIAVPNPESWDANYYKEFWAAWDMPIHLSHFKKKDIQTLAELINCEVVEIKNMPLDAFYISLLSEKYKTGRRRWLVAFGVGLCSNFIGRNRNTSSLTYILRKL